MKSRHNYKNLDIWKNSIVIADEIFRLTKTFPKEEIYGLVSQINRSSISISSNIAEGSSRSNRSFSNFLDIALGSSFELETQIILARNRNYISELEFRELEAQLTEFQRMTTGFKETLID